MSKFRGFLNSKGMEKRNPSLELSPEDRLRDHLKVAGEKIVTMNDTVLCGELRRQTSRYNKAASEDKTDIMHESLQIMDMIKSEMRNRNIDVVSAYSVSA